MTVPYIPGTEICPMTIADIPSCLRIISEEWGASHAQFTEDDLREMFAKPRQAPFYYVTKVEGVITGLAGRGPSGINWGVYYLFYVVVRKSFRHWGMGKMLVQQCLDDIDVLDGVTLITTYIPNFYQPFDFEILDRDLQCAGNTNVLMRRQCASQRKMQVP